MYRGSEKSWWVASPSRELQKAVLKEPVDVEEKICGMDHEGTMARVGRTVTESLINMDRNPLNWPGVAVVNCC